MLIGTIANQCTEGTSNFEKTSREVMELPDSQIVTVTHWTSPSQLTVEQHREVLDVLSEHVDIFTDKTDDTTAANIPFVDKQMKDNITPVNLPPYRQRPMDRRALNDRTVERSWSSDGSTQIYEIHQSHIYSER